MSNIIYIHAAAMKKTKQGIPNVGRCQSILDMIKSHIINSKIYEDVDSITLNVVGDDIPVNFNVPKSKINYLPNHIHDWEFPTLDMIIDYSREHPDDNVLYIHTQGVSNPSTKLMEERREYLLYFNVAQYKKCLKMLKENDTCGVMLIDTPVKHYSQNFWWSRCSHINSIGANPRDMEQVFNLRHNAEFWICSNTNGKYSTINNLYDHYLKADNFAPELYR